MADEDMPPELEDFTEVLQLRYVFLLSFSPSCILPPSNLPATFKKPSPIQTKRKSCRERTPDETFVARVAAITSSSTCFVVRCDKKRRCSEDQRSQCSEHRETNSCDCREEPV